MLSRLRQKKLSGDENLPFDPLGVALGNKHISRNEYEMGRNYEKFFALNYGKPHAKNVNLERLRIHPSQNTDKELKIKQILELMDNVLQDSRRDVANACVYHIFPHKYDHLKMGLEKLVKLNVVKIYEKL